LAQDLGEAVLKLTTDDKELSKGLDKANADSTKAGKEIAANFIVAMTAAVVFAEKLIGAWAVAERAQTQLNFAVKTSTSLYGGAAGRLSEFAEQMKDLAGIDDDLIKSQLGVAATFGLTEQQMKDVMTAALNLSSMGIVSLEQAVRGLSGSFDGNIGMLGRYVPSLKDLTKEQLAAGDAVKLVNENFKGMAEALGDTLSGKIAKLQISFGDLQEQMGRALSYSAQPLIGVFTAVLNSLGNVIQSTFDLRDAQIALKNGTATAEQKILGLNESLKANLQQIEEVSNRQKTLYLNFGEGIMSSAGFKNLQAQLIDLQKARNIMQGIVDAAYAEIKASDAAENKKAANAAIAKAREEKRLSDAESTMEQLLAWSDETQERDEEAAAAGVVAFEKANEARIADAIATVAALLKYSDAYQKAIEDEAAANNKEWKDGEDKRVKEAGATLAALLKDSDDYQKGIEDEAAANLKVQKEAAAAVAKAWKDSWNSTMSYISGVVSQLTSIMNQYFTNLNAQNANSLQTQLNAIDTKYQADKAAIESSLMSEDDKTKALMKLDKDYQTEKTAAEKEAQNEKNKIELEMFRAKKLASLADVAINTAKAIVTTFAELGFTPWGIIAAGLMGGMGLLQAGLIAAQPEPVFPALAQGGDFIVPPGYPNDSFPMRVESGEHVSVTPAGESGGIPLDITVKLEESVLARWIGKASRNQTIMIHAGAIVP